MRLTFKFALLAVALAYGGTAISALPVGKSSLAVRDLTPNGIAPHGDAHEVVSLFATTRLL
jgi:hypothetical protein